MNKMNSMEVRTMPEGDSSTPTKYAGKDFDYTPKAIVKLKDGRSVFTLNYDKSLGRLVVMEVYKDGQPDTRPAFRIDPDELDNN